MIPSKDCTTLLLFLVLGTIGFAQNSPVADEIQELTDRAWEYTLDGRDSALVLSERALDISKKNDFPLGEVLARESIGLFHEIVTGDIEAASEQYFSAIELCEKHELSYLASMYHTLGIMFHTTDNYDNAKQYYQMSLDQARAQQDSFLIKKCLINLGSIHSSLEDFAEAETLMLESLEIPIEPGMDYTTLGNLGYLYVKQERFNEAIPILLRATEKHPDNPDPDLNLYFLLHAKTMAQDSSNMTEALARAKLAADSETYGLRDQSLLYRNIADYLTFTGHYREALDYRNKYVEVFEEIKEKQRDQVVLDLEAKYENEKKEAQLQVLQLETEKKAQQNRLYLALALAGLLIAGLVGFFLYKNREKNKLLTTQKKQLQENVDEINLLLREIHHRVKNNLQVITSLLNIQQRAISDEKAHEALQECKNRIESMGLIHRSFYQNKNLGEVNTREYIQNLTRQIVDSYSTEKQPIELETRIQDIYLDMDTLVPLGLIINEMVSNTLKHAFEENESGKLSISLEQITDQFTLEISDNGSSLNDLESLEKSESFGMSMIQAFVQKMNGQIRLLETEGTTFQIQFAA
jgi:two-component sensor histidine kinase